MGAFKDLTKTNFGNLTVTDQKEVRGKGRTHWLCKCRCGGSIWVRMDHLTSGRTTNCAGCPLRPRYSRHGMSDSPVYKSWTAMRERINNPAHPHFSHYGGRGIKICERWQSFENFYIDMGERPEGTSLDRKDNNGDYHKENCRWSTMKEQNRNKSNSVFLELNGEKHSVTVWAEKLGISRQTIFGRVMRGYPPELALSTEKGNHFSGSRGRYIRKDLRSS